ncbi:MAG TPA: MaoC/PaaZ C-terminal domain-containing protein [Acidimicrobiia bacterium]|nr:MaoC/PaaZ C-terminal domain-containing protein [Acidimicrobiia bacterium]
MSGDGPTPAPGPAVPGATAGRPLFLEDLAEGQVYESAGRTITEADVVAFAGVSGDWNQIHTNAEYARETPYGQRVVYGLLTLSVMTGLLDRTGLFSGTTIAMLGIEWKFAAPVFIGDTLSFRLTIQGVRRTRAGDRGVVQRSFELLNQRGEIVGQGRLDAMVRARRMVKAADG